MQIRGIRTKYKGIWFRSQLEAKWAILFDLLGWPWEYEPFELAGYIPDFALPFQSPLLVEVKPAFSRKELEPHREKIEKSGWLGEAAIVGATVNMEPGSCFNDECNVIGILAEREKDDQGGLVWSWGGATLGRYEGPPRDHDREDKNTPIHWSLVHDVCGYNCRTCNYRHYWKGIYGRKSKIQDLWAEANNVVRWHWNRED